MDGSWDFCLLGLLVKNDLLRLLYLPIKAFTTTILKFSNDMSSPSFIKIVWLFTCVNPWDQRTCWSKSNTCFYDRACKQLVFDPLCLHHLCHCCKTSFVRTRIRNVPWTLSCTGSFENIAWKDSFKWSMSLIVWSLSVLSCFVLSTKWYSECQRYPQNDCNPKTVICLTIGL